MRSTPGRSSAESPLRSAKIDAASVVVQGGAYGEHHIISVDDGQRVTPINNAHFTINIAPGAGVRVLRYGPPEAAPAPRAALATMIERASANPLGIPEPHGDALEALFAAHAPLFEIETGDVYDRPGARTLIVAEPRVLGEHVGEHQDAAQRVVDLMGDPGNQFAKRGEFFRARQLVIDLGDFFGSFKDLCLESFVQLPIFVAGILQFDSHGVKGFRQFADLIIGFQLQLAVELHIRYLAGMQ